MKPPLPVDESDRLQALRDYAVLDTLPESDFDDIVQLAAEICGVPIALITLIDEKRQWFKAKVGVNDDGTTREAAFCAHAITRPKQLLVVDDATKDERFADNPFVTEANGIRFYAGAPLVTSGGHALGTLCVIDRVPRKLKPDQRRALTTLSRQVMAQLQLRRQNREQGLLLRRFNDAQAVAKVGSWETDLKSMAVIWSEQTHRIFGTNPAVFKPTHEAFLELVHPDDRAAVDAAFTASLQTFVPDAIEHRVCMADGRSKILEERWAVMRDNVGVPVRAIGTCQDITERRRLEDEKQKLVSDLRARVRELRALQLVSNLLRRDDLPSGEVLAQIAALILPAMQYPEFSAARVTFADQERTAGEVRETPWMLEGKFATTTGAAGFLQVMYREECPAAVVGPFTVEERDLIEALTEMLRSYFERREAAAAIGRGQTLARMAGRLGRMGSWSVNLTQMRSYWSDEVCAIHGVPPGYQASVEEGVNFYAPEFRPQIEREFGACVREGRPFDLELQIINTAGERVWVRSIGEAVRDAAGQITAVQGAFQDITERKAAAELVRDSEERFRTLLQGVPTVAIQGYRLDGTVTYWNHASEVFYGYTAAEALGDNLLRLIIPDEMQAEVRAALAHVTAGGEIPNGELNLQRKDGTRILVFSSHAVIRRSGQAPELFCIDIDLSARQTAEAALRKSEERYRLLFEQNPQPMWVYDRETLRFLAVNGAAVRHYGYSNKEFLQLTIKDIRPPEDVPALLENLAMMTGSISNSGIWRHRLKDGHLIHVEISGHVMEFDGRPAELILANDVTERVRAEETLRRSAESLAAAQAIAQVGNWELDLASGRSIWSAELYRLLYRDPSVGPPSLDEFLQLVHPEDRPICKQAIARLPDAREAYEFVYRTNPALGEIRHLKAVAHVSHDEHGRVVGATGTAQDITTQTESAKALNAAFKEANDFKAALDEHAIVAITDPRGRITYVNDRFCTIAQYSRDELIGQDHRLINSGRHSKEFIRDLWTTIRAGRVWSGEIQNRAKDGSLYWVSTTIVPFIDAQGKPRQYVAIRTDVTEQRRVAAELQASERKYRLLFANNPQPMWVFDAETLRFLAVNNAAVQHYGYTEPEFLAMTVLDIREDSDRTKLVAALAKMPTGGRDFGLRRHQKKDGTIIEVEASSDGVMVDGRSARLVLALDVTERRKAVAKVHEQAALLDKAQDAIMVRDLSHRITYWNQSAERLYGWSEAEAMGQPLDLLLQIDPEKFAEADQIVKEKGEWSGEIKKFAKNETQLTVDVRWTLLRDDKGQPHAILSINTDITEKKKLEQQFLRAQRMESIGTLAGGIAHDLNNLLAPVVMGVSLLRQFQPSDQAQRVITNIERSAKRGTDLVKQVLSFARGVEGTRVAVHLKHIVREIVDMAHSTFPKNIVIETDLPHDLSLVTGDPTQLNQVLLNLCVNARDAMPQGGRVTISATNTTIDAQYAAMNRGASAGRYVRLEVTDTGSGMSPEVLERIFDPFFTTKELGRGTGLGLSTTMGIVRSHGGFINVYSEVGKGSTFRVYLPAQTNGPDAAEAPPDQGQMLHGSGELILLVDDESTIVSVTQQTLEAFGYKVLTAEDGAQAIGLYAVHQKEIAVVLTDMMMPVMDGPALISALLRINPQVKIIAASGLNANENVAKATHRGVRHFLAKPYTAEVMLDMVRQILREPGNHS